MKFKVVYQLNANVVEEEFEADNWQMATDDFIDFYNDKEAFRETVVQYNKNKVIAIYPVREDVK